ncbi:hypothetical protein BLNAU_22126 [Blattamonas nauphoetae]|uniref:Uncharacterized protein n=1 Tax=Blattamonas nauphoetae TaxID=2049346 RepID=A0ABQ9WU00_9EUKA|nr:hypothetical protein BLNAU_22126 [Blattamonas nauphoetae]
MTTELRSSQKQVMASTETVLNLPSFLHRMAFRIKTPAHNWILVKNILPPLTPHLAFQHFQTHFGPLQRPADPISDKNTFLYLEFPPTSTTPQTLLRNGPVMVSSSSSHFQAIRGCHVVLYAVEKTTVLDLQLLTKDTDAVRHAVHAALQSAPPFSLFLRNHPSTNSKYTIATDPFDPTSSNFRFHRHLFVLFSDRLSTEAARDILRQNDAVRTLTNCQFAQLNSVLHNSMFMNFEGVDMINSLKPDRFVPAANIFMNALEEFFKRQWPIEDGGVDKLEVWIRSNALSGKARLAFKEDLAGQNLVQTLLAVEGGIIPFSVTMDMEYVGRMQITGTLSAFNKKEGAGEARKLLRGKNRTRRIGSSSSRSSRRRHNNVHKYPSGLNPRAQQFVPQMAQGIDSTQHPILPKISSTPSLFPFLQTLPPQLPATSMMGFPLPSPLSVKERRSEKKEPSTDVPRMPARLMEGDDFELLLGSTSKSFPTTPRALDIFQSNELSSQFSFRPDTPLSGSFLSFEDDEESMFDQVIDFYNFDSHPPTPSPESE